MDGSSLTHRLNDVATLCYLSALHYSVRFSAEMKFSEQDESAQSDGVVPESREDSSGSDTILSSEGNKEFQTKGGSHDAVESPPIFRPPRGFWERKKKTVMGAAGATGVVILFGIVLITSLKKTSERTSEHPRTSLKTTSPERTSEHRRTSSSTKE